MSGQSVNGASSLPEELLIAAASDVSNSSIGQGLAHQFNLNAPGAEFQTVLNGIPSNDVQSLLEGGQSISVMNGSASNSTVSSEPELVDAGEELSVPLMQNLEQEKNIDVVPVNATIELRTAHDDLTYVLPTTRPTPAAGGAPPVVQADFFFDGSGNDGNVDSLGPNPTATNVWKMYKADATSPIVPIYEYGVGTIAADANEAFALVGKATGLEADQIIDNAWTYLIQDINQGANTIDIVGFSRGSAEALEFLNRIADSVSGVRNLIPALDADGKPEYVTVNGQRQEVYIDTSKVTVRFVGLYDTVSTFFGIPGYTADKRVSIPTTLQITQVVHAVALSEHRADFPWTNLAQPGIQNLLQEGFVGAHADIGGGYGNGDGLSNITLHWMMYWAGQTGWVLNTNMYANLVDNYDPVQVHNSQNGTGPLDHLAYALTLPINRNFPISLRIWESDPFGNSPAGAAAVTFFNPSERFLWDPFWWMAKNNLL